MRRRQLVRTRTSGVVPVHATQQLRRFDNHLDDVTVRVRLGTAFRDEAQDEMFIRSLSCSSLPRGAVAGCAGRRHSDGGGNGVRPFLRRHSQWRGVCDPVVRPRLRRESRCFFPRCCPPPSFLQSRRVVGSVHVYCGWREGGMGCGGDGGTAARRRSAGCGRVRTTREGSW